MASLHAPLLTLRPAPYGTRRTARGRRDSLGLHRSGLSPPAPCRSPDALPTALKIDACPGWSIGPFQRVGPCPESQSLGRLVLSRCLWGSTTSGTART